MCRETPRLLLNLLTVSDMSLKLGYFIVRQGPLLFADI